jgi:surfactin synthase thioesterase subunit
MKEGGRVSKVLVPYGKQGTGRALVTFPFAGGKADLFKDWHHFFDSLGLGVLSVQYRGRFPEGMQDVVLRDMEEVAAEVATALETELQVSAVFF